MRQTEDTQMTGSRMWVSGVALAILGAGLATACVTLRDFCSLVIVLAVALFAWGWGRLVHAPAPAVSGTISFIVAIVSGVLVRLTLDVAWAAVVAAFIVIAAFIGEIARGAERTCVLGSIATSVAGSIIGLAGAAWIALEAVHAWLVLAYPTGIVLVAAGLSFLLRGGRWLRVGGSIVVSTLGGLAALGVVLATGLAQGTVLTAIGANLGVGDPLSAMLLIFAGFGLVAGLVVAACHAFFSGRLEPVTVRAALALGMIPMLVMGVPVYAFARLAGI